MTDPRALQVESALMSVSRGMQNLTQNLQGFIEEDSLVPSFSKRKRDRPSENDGDVGITEPLSITAMPEQPVAPRPEPEPGAAPAPNASSVSAPELPAPEPALVQPPISDPTAKESGTESVAAADVTSAAQGDGEATSARDASELQAIVGQLRAELMHEVNLWSCDSPTPHPPSPLSPSTDAQTVMVDRWTNSAKSSSRRCGKRPPQHRSARLLRPQKLSTLRVPMRCEGLKMTSRLRQVAHKMQCRQRTKPNQHLMLFVPQRRAIWRPRAIPRLATFTLCKKRYSHYIPQPTPRGLIDPPFLVSSDCASVKKAAR